MEFCAHSSNVSWILVYIHFMKDDIIYFVCVFRHENFLFSFPFLFLKLAFLFAIPGSVCVFHLTLLLRQIISDGEGVAVAVGAAI